MNSYQIAYDRACRLLAAADLPEVCRRCGAVLVGKRIALSFFGRNVEVRLPEAPSGVAAGAPQVEFNPAELSLAEKILILHYLTSQGAYPVKGELVSFKKLPGASFYDPTYRKRGPERIAGKFGGDPELFRRAYQNLGWKAGDLGDASCRLEVLPRIQALVVLHRRDEEFPPEANILFNDEIVNFLPLEDVAVLAGLIAGRLAKAV